MEARSCEDAFDETWRIYQKIPGGPDPKPAGVAEDRRKKAA
jgi:hypothetical protein